MADYFDENPKFSEDTFRHRFRMSKSLFLKIVSDVQAYDEWFQEGLDGRMKKSFTPLQKVTSAIKQLATGNPPDEGDEYLNMSERTSRECLEYFCETVCKRYGGMAVNSYVDQRATTSRYCIRLMRIGITYLAC
ncbi:hypothetical protein HanXRQr2_Chr12g0525661 [Helianthus annuus]|uniref:Harbinger transposase-derived protein n=1 Tax=Helianthus annuus TaxID=4232 RepID=A0A251SZR4_HELAN|nr:hypothetical protein HanXRQr2_Chr12g0525661 [Helianthus annuus]KAJ0895488.1 hypothetical protein HanPSC8_Chr09g0401151 [Helianthus annuus]